MAGMADINFTITVDDQATPVLEQAKARLDQLRAKAGLPPVDVDDEVVLAAPEIWAHEIVTGEG